MSLFDQKLAVRIAGDELRQLGYDLPQLPRMNVREWIVYCYRAARFRLLDLARWFLYHVGWLKMSREKSAQRQSQPRS